MLTALRKLAGRVFAQAAQFLFVDSGTVTAQLCVAGAL